MKIQRRLNFGREKGYESSQVSGSYESGMKLHGGPRACVRDKVKGGGGGGRLLSALPWKHGTAGAASDTTASNGLIRQRLPVVLACGGDAVLADWPRVLAGTLSQTFPGVLSASRNLSLLVLLPSRSPSRLLSPVVTVALLCENIITLHLRP